MHGISSYHHGTHSAMEQNSPTIPLIIRSYLICLRIKVKWCHRGDILHYAADIISLKAESWVIPVQIISFKSGNSHTSAASLDTKVDGWVIFKILVRLPLSQKIKDKSLSVNWSQLTQFTLDNNKQPESLQRLECIFYILIFIEYQSFSPSFFWFSQPVEYLLLVYPRFVFCAISLKQWPNKPFFTGWGSMEEIDFKLLQLTIELYKLTCIPGWTHVDSDPIIRLQIWYILCQRQNLGDCLIPLFINFSTSALIVLHNSTQKMSISKCVVFQKILPERWCYPCRNITWRPEGKALIFKILKTRTKKMYVINSSSYDVTPV